MDYDNLTREVVRNFFGLHRTAPQQQLNKLSRGELMMLHYLIQHQGRALPGELSAAMEVSSARTAALLNSLERKGEISRVPDEEDHRRVRVILTEAGRERIQRTHEDAHQRLKHLLCELGDRDAAELLRLLQRLNAIAQSDRPDTESEPGNHP